MSLPAEQFLQGLADSGLMSADDLQTLRAEASPQTTSGEELAEQLVHSGRLTRYQAQALLKGDGRTLVLGNYVVLDRIGAGGMGVVLKARHRRMKRLVALKLLPKSATESEDALRRFHREVEAAARLNHPHIVTAYDADEAKGVHFFVMEYVEGSDLSSLVKQRGPLAIDEAVDCILQAAGGLAYAHRQGIIHRDIKPSNLLMNPQGVVQILDMGLARIDAAETDDHTELTGTGTIMGTLDYMSPEQALDTKHADRRTDIYSLGATLHYLLTARPVLTGKTQGQKLQALLAADTHQPASLCVRRNDVPPELEQVFQRMAARDPGERYQSMDEVLTALQPFGTAHQLASGSSATGTMSSATGTATLDEPLSDLALQRFLDAQSQPATQLQTPEPEVSSETFSAGPSDPTRIASAAVEPSVLTPSALVRRRKRDQRRTTLFWIGGALLLAAGMLSAPLLMKVETPIGTMVIKVHQDAALGAEVTIDGEQVTTIKTANGRQSVRVEASEQERLLKVTKEGFESFTKRFTIKEGGETLVEVWLEPEFADDAMTVPLETRQSVIARVLKLGGKVQVLQRGGIPLHLKSVQEVSDIGAFDWDNLGIELERPAGLHDRDILDIAAALPKLRYLNIASVDLTRAVLPGLSGLGQLQVLGIHGLKGLGDADIPLFNSLTKLVSLGINSAGEVTDAGIEHLAEHPNAPRFLSLMVNSQPISDVGVRRLAEKMPNLQSLNLNMSKVSDASIPLLARLPLTALHMQGTNLTDVSVPSLSGLHTLVLLNLQGTGITEEGMLRLREALPNCEIAWDGGTITPTPVVAWQTGPADDVLPGIIPRPATLAGVKRWQVETIAPRVGVSCAAYSPDGKVLAVASYIGHIRLLDADTLELLALWPGARGVTDLEWSPDGLHLAVCEPGRPVRIYSREGVLLYETDVRPHRSLAWDPAGGRLAIGGNDDRKVHLYSLDDQRSVVIGEGPPKGAPIELAWSPDGRWIATGWSEGEVRLWQPDGTAGPELQAFDSRVESLAWSPDSRQLAAVAGNEVRLWSRDGTLIRQLRELQSQPAHLVWEPDNQTLLIAGAVQTMRWNTLTDTPHDLPPRENGDYTTGLLWRPGSDREFVRCDTFGAVDIVAADGTLRTTTGRSGSIPDGLAIRPQGDRFVTVSWDGSVRLWDRQGHAIAANKGHNNRGFDAAWKSDGSEFATAGADTTIRTWSMDGDPLRALRTGGDQHQYAVTWDPQTNRLAAGGQGGIVRMWSGNDDQPREMEAARTGEQWISLRFSPDGHRLAADSQDGVWIWTKDRTGPFLADPLKLPVGMPGKLAWRPDGEAIALVSNVGARVVQLDGTVVGSFKTPGSPLDVAWSPAGDALAIAGHDRAGVRLYSPEGTHLRSLGGPLSATYSVDWCTDGTWIAAGEAACVVHVWNAGSGEPEWVGLQLPDLKNVSFTAAGQIIDGEMDLLDRRLICLVESDIGQIELVKPSEFQQRSAPDWRVDSPAPIDFANERAVAGWVQNIGGGLQWHLADNPYDTVEGHWGDELKPLPEGPFTVRTVLLDGNQRVTSDDLRQLTSLAELRQLNLMGAAIDDGAMPHIAGCRSLQMLYLSGPGVTSAATATLVELPLQSMVMHGVGLTQEGLDDISQISSLTNLSIASNDLAPLDLSVLARIPGLTDLGIHETNVGDEDLPELLVLPSLKGLHLGKTRITDAALAMLAQLNQLQSLRLNHNPAITDAAVETLTGMTGLDDLHIDHTGITPEGVERLHLALPDCAILWDGGVITRFNPAKDREVAEWVHAQGGTVGIGSESLAYVTVAPGEPLPDVPFALVTLDLFQQPITNADLARLDGLRHFTTLILNVTTIGDEGIAQLGNLPALQKLYLGGTQLTDAGLADLCERYPRIEILHAGGTGLTDAGIPSLLKWPALHQVHISGLPLTDAVVDTLVQLQSLTDLELPGTQITQAGIDRLHQALPGCRIVWDGGTIEPDPQ